MTGREAAEQQERDEATATRRRAVEAQAAHDEGKRWQASMLADLHLRQNQRDNRQSPPNDPSTYSSSNTSSISNDSDSETGEPRRSGRVAKKSSKATDNSQQRREGVGSNARRQRKGGLSRAARQRAAEQSQLLDDFEVDLTPVDREKNA